MSAPQRAEAFARQLGVSRTIASWLLQQGHDDVALTRRFFEPKLAELTAPDAMADRQAAADRLARAVRQQERVVIFGDYDCDGITATAILCEALREIGALVTPMLASRFAGGYGVSPAALQRIVENDPQVVVTCDCGSSDHESLAVLQERGVDVIVIDHHLVPERPLPALAFLNPHRPQCGFAYKGLASCGLALSVVAAVRSALGVTLDVRRWLDLVAIGTIADVAPLTGDNRALVRSGIERLVRAERPGVRALFEVAGLELGTPMTARDVAFRLAPRLNAPGRLGPPDVALQLLIAKDAATATALAGRVEQTSSERKAAQQQIVEQATSEVQQAGYDRQAAIVVGREGWNPGIVGIVAGRLAEQYALPVIMCGVQDQVARGSVRGPRGFRLHDALSQVQDVLVRFGGHQAAAGLEVRVNRLEELRQRFVEVCARAPRAEPSAFGDSSVALHPGDDPEAIARDLERLEPCGEGNPRPKIELHARVVQARTVKGGHGKLELELPGQRRLGCFWPGSGEQAADLSGAEVTVTGDLQRNRWRGSTTLELLAERLQVRA